MGGGSNAVIEQEKLAGIQIQTSTYGGPVPIVYGTGRVSANLIWHDDFTAIKHKESQGGKGGGGGGVTTITYTYTASVILALAEGPVASVNRVWVDKEIRSLSSLGMSFFAGNRTQSPWSYLTTKHPTKAIGYAGTAIVAHAKLDLGSSGALKNHSFEVTGLFSGGPAGSDANAADILPDFLTNQYYGAGWDTSRIGDLTVWRTYTQACGLFLSPVFNEQKPAIEHVNDLLQATNSAAVWSQGVLKILPFGDTTVTGNGTTYTPNTTPLYDLTNDDFIVSGPDDDPVKVKRRGTADAFNSVPVEFLDRAQDYNTNVVEEPDPVDVEVFGLKRAPALNLPMVTRASAAQQLSRIHAQRSVYCRNIYEFRLGWRYVLLEGMDLVTLTDSTLGLNQTVVRIKEVEEDEEGTLTVRAEEWPFGVAHAALFDTQTGDGTAPDVNADPGNANTPAIFEPSILLTSGVEQLWLATSGGPLWGGCEVWISTDNATYSLAGIISSPARHGTLTATLATGTTDDTTHTLAVALLGGGELPAATAQDKNDLLTLCWVDGEFMAYQNSTLTGTDAYSLTTLKRGAYGSPISAHASGTKFVRCDEALFHYDIPDSRIGQQIWIKLVSVNIWGGGKQDISTLSPYTYTIAGTQYLPPGPTACSMAVTTTKPA